MTLGLLGLVLAGLAFWLTARLRRAASPAPLVLLAAAYLGPALFVAATLYVASEEEPPQLRFALLGLGFRTSDDGGPAVTVGGDRGSHGVWVSAFDDGTAEVDPAGGRPAEDDPRARALAVARVSVVPSAGGGPGRLSLEPSPNPEAPGLIALRSDGGRLRPATAVELLEGDLVTVAGRTWRVERGGLFGPPASFVEQPALSEPGDTTSGGTPGAEKLDAAGADATSSEEAERRVLPRRRGSLPIAGLSYPILRAAPAAAATYPVAWLDRGPEEPPSAGAPGEFFFLEPAGLAGSSLWIDRLGGGVTVERDGVPLEPSPALDLGQTARLYAASHPRWSADEFQAGGIRDRRSFRWRAGERSLSVAFDTPEVYVLPWPDLVQLAGDLGEGAEPTSTPVADNAPGDGASQPEGPLRVHLSMGGWQLVDASLYLRHVSLPVALEALTILELPRDPRGSLAEEDNGFSAATPRGQRPGSLGQVLWLGSEHLAAVQVDILRAPWALGALALLLAIARIAAARAVRLSMPQVLVVAAVETLVALRLLLGYQAWAAPPFEEEAYRLALVAWMFLPWALLVVAVPAPLLRDGTRRAFVACSPLVGGWLLSFAWCLRLGGGGVQTLVWSALHVAVLAVPAARAAGWLERAAHLVEARLERPRSERRTLVLWCLLACAPGLLRLGLVVAGFRESLQLGSRFALTLVHIPLALALQALFLVWLWRRSEGRGRLLWRDLVPAAVFVLGSWLAPALVVSDLGLALLNVPVFLLALTLVSLDLRRRLGATGPEARRHWAPAVALTFAVVFVALPAGARVLLATVDAVVPDAIMAGLESERNYLRLLDFAYPQRLEEVARRTSEELAVMSAVLRVYTTAPLGGRGWPHTEISPHIRATALREHVPAVFVASQWGLLGTAGLVLVLLVAMAAAPPLLPGRLDDDALFPDLREAGLWSPLGSLAALTLALPSLYMVLANYRLALFTGKNAYLLGLDSTADVLEALLLASLAMVGAAAARDHGEL
ncbi:MAG: hypothetical protein AAGD06_14295 [Acidobacteriota bacterium]